MTESPPIELLHVITDSRPGGRVQAVADRIERWCLKEQSVRLHVLDPAGADSDPAVVTASHAVVFTTPIYKASYAGTLKSWLDFLPIEALWWKPTAIIGVGASDHHYLALDAQLRFTLTWFGALCLPVSSYLTPADLIDGQLTNDAASQLDELVDTACEVAGRIAGLQKRGPVPLAARH